MPVGVAPTSAMLKKKIDELFHRIPNVFGITDDILIVGFDELGRNHNETVDGGLKYTENQPENQHTSAISDASVSPSFGNSYLKMVWTKTLGY